MLGNRIILERLSSITNVTALDMSGSQGSSSTLLTQIVRISPHLTYLDLSSNLNFDHNSAGLLAALQNLQILSLRSVQLSNPSVFSRLAEAIGTKVFSLDLRHNNLTDSMISSLLDYCLPPPSYDSPPAFPTVPASSPWFSPPTWPTHDTKPASPSLTRDTWHAHTTPPHPQAHVHTQGLTHLYISSNPRLTTLSLTSLLSTQRLRHLDFGTVHHPSNHHPHPTHNTINLLEILDIPGTRTNLDWLRLDHRLMTGHHLTPSEHSLHLRTLFERFPTPSTLILTNLPTTTTKQLTRRIKLLCYLAAMYEAALSERRWKTTHPETTPSKSGYPILHPEKAKYLRTVVVECGTIDRVDEIDAERGAETVFGDEDASAFREKVEGDFSFFAEREGVGSGDDFSFFAGVAEGGEGDFSFFEGEGRKREGEDAGKTRRATSGGGESVDDDVVQAGRCVGVETEDVEGEDSKRWGRVLEICERSLDMDECDEGSGQGEIRTADELRRFGRGRIWPRALEYDVPGKERARLDWSGRLIVLNARGG